MYHRHRQHVIIADIICTKMHEFTFLYTKYYIHEHNLHKYLSYNTLTLANLEKIVVLFWLY